MKVGQVCIREVAIVHEHESVVDAARVMREHHVGDVVVVRDVEGARVPLGILTDRDLVVEVLAQVPERSPQLEVGEVASTSKLVTVTEHEELEVAIARMQGHAVRRLPVVDDRGRLVGIVALDDVMEFLGDQLARVIKIPARQEQLERTRRP